ncbi:MAG: hypothetical protein K1X79_02835 [Oligoflexia bacterium]|nr:hypothetical protein [Oligoflexia bacterium]
MSRRRKISRLSKAIGFTTFIIASLSLPTWAQCRVVQQDTSIGAAEVNAQHWHTTQWGPLPTQISFFVSNCPALQALDTAHLISDVIVNAQIVKPSGGTPDTRYGFLFDRSDPDAITFALRFIPEEVGTYQVNTTISLQGQPLAQASALVESEPNTSTEARGPLIYSATSPSKLRDKRSRNVVVLQGINDGHDVATTLMAPFGYSGASDYKLDGQSAAERDISPNVSPETSNLDSALAALDDATNAVRLMLPNGFLSTYQNSSGESISMNDDSLKAAVVFDRRIFAHAAKNKYIWLTALRDTTTYASSIDGIAGMRSYLRYICARWGAILSVLQFLNEPRGTNRSLALDFAQSVRGWFGGLLSIGWTDANTPVDAAGSAAIMDAHLYVDDQGILNQGANGDLAISSIRATLQSTYGSLYSSMIPILGEVGHYATVAADHQYDRSQVSNDRRMLAATFEGIGGALYWPSAKTNCGTGPTGPYLATEIFRKEHFTLNLIDRVMRKIAQPDLALLSVTSNDTSVRIRALSSPRTLGILVLGADRSTAHASTRLNASIPAALDYKVYDINTGQILGSGRSSGTITLPSFRDGVIVVGWLPGQEVNTKPILALQTSASSNPYHRPHLECGPMVRDTLNGDRNTVFTLSARAIDLEGDATSFSWSFDDGSPSLQNVAQITHQFPPGVWHTNLAAGGSTLVAQAAILGDVAPAVVNTDRIHNKWTPQQVRLCPGQGIPYTIGVNYTEQRSANGTYDYLLQESFIQSFLSSVPAGVSHLQTSYGPSTVVIMPRTAQANSSMVLTSRSGQRSGTLTGAPVAVNVEVGDCNDSPVLGGGLSVSNSYDFFSYEPNGETVRFFLLLFNGDCSASNLTQHYLATIGLAASATMNPNTKIYRFNIPSGVGNYQLCAVPFGADPHDKIGFGPAVDISGYSALSLQKSSKKKLSKREKRTRERKRRSAWIQNLKRVSGNQQIPGNNAGFILQELASALPLNR